MSIIIAESSSSSSIVFAGKGKFSQGPSPVLATQQPPLPPPDFSQDQFPSLDNEADNK
jgi:hypothetical protein